MKRSSSIQSDYIVLWPTDDYISKRTKKKYVDLFPIGSDNDTLRNIAKRLVKTVVRLENTNGADERVQIIEELEQLDRKYTELDLDYPTDKNLLYMLSNLENEISIVFQNKHGIDRCVLFTGDVRGKATWKFIEKNLDSKIAMHTTYNIIKIPHHGTNPFYHPFGNYTNKDTYYLIPNGGIRHATWYISSSYSRDINAKGCNVICSNNTSCQSVAAGICSCKKCNFAHNINGYFDI